MSERRPIDEITDPGPPPEEALDATLRALGAPVPAQTRRTAESAGLEAAHYHAEPHRPPRPHEPSPSPNVVMATVTTTTDPMAPAVAGAVPRDTLRMAPPRAARRDLTTVPGAAATPSRMSVFGAALLFVVVVLGIAAWALFLRGGNAEGGASTAAASAPAGGSGQAITPTASLSPIAVASATPSPVAPSGPTASAASGAPGANSGTIETSSATPDPPRPTGRATTTTTTTPAPPRRVPGAAVATGTAPTPSPASAPPGTTPPAPSPAPTTKYNHLLNEDKQ